MLKVYELNIEVVTPLIVARPLAGNIVRHETSYISGQTIRGAFLFNAYIKGMKDRVENESKRPTLIFHPAYPIIDGRNTVPAHPFIYKCKVCGMVMDHLPALFKENFDLTRAPPPDTCPGGHKFAMKSLGGGLVIKRDNGFISAEGIKYVRVENVGMSKKFRTSEVGMIYNYICIAPGQRFRSLIVDVGEDNLELLGYRVGQPFRLYLGRGSTRGLGHVEMRITELGMESLTKEVERKVSDSPSHLLLLAKAPIFSVRYVEGSAMPSLHHEIPPLTYKEGWIPKTIFYSGFSLTSRLPKAKLLCASPGSLYHYSLPTKSNDDLIDKLVKVALIGLPPHNHLGLNLLEVL